MMKNTLEKITVSTQVFPTASAAISGASALGMDLYRQAVARVSAHRLPDAKGEGVITLSLYETTNSVLNGQEIAASVVTGSITSASDVVLEVEIDSNDLTINSGYKNIYPYVVSSTPTVLECTVVRDEKRYQ